MEARAFARIGAASLLKYVAEIEAVASSLGSTGHTMIATALLQGTKRATMVTAKFIKELRREVHLHSSEMHAVTEGAISRVSQAEKLVQSIIKASAEQYRNLETSSSVSVSEAQRETASAKERALNLSVCFAPPRERRGLTNRRR